MGIGSWGWWGFEGLGVWGEANLQVFDRLVCCCSLIFLARWIEAVLYGSDNVI